MAKKMTLHPAPIFEQIKRLDENGTECWSARDLARVLDYAEYRKFLPVIVRAKEACQNSGHPLADHIEDILDMVAIGSGAQREVAAEAGGHPVTIDLGLRREWAGIAAGRQDGCR